MLTAILVIEAIKLCVIGVLVYNTWPRKKGKTGGWIAPAIALPDDEDSNVIAMTERYEEEFLSQQEPNLDKS